ncbi:unnamed protein product, partial [Polarella glacialis]
DPRLSQVCRVVLAGSERYVQRVPRSQAAWSAAAFATTTTRTTPTRTTRAASAAAWGSSYASASSSVDAGFNATDVAAFSAASDS